MKLTMLFMRSKRARRPVQPTDRDWTQTWSPRDWADLPTHHPKQPD
jgi:hypothetical protein